MLIASVTGGLWTFLVGPMLRTEPPRTDTPAIEATESSVAYWPPAGQPLSGLVIYLSPGHGRYLQRSRLRSAHVLTWDFQREVSPYDLREDLWTVEFAADRLVPQLEALGATVISLRELERSESITQVADAPTSGRALWTGEDWVIDGSARWSIRAPVDDEAARLSMKWAGDCHGEVIVRSESSHHRVQLPASGHGGHWWPLGKIRGDATVDIEADGCRLTTLKAGGGLFEPPSEWGVDASPVPMWHIASSHYLPSLPEELAVDERNRPLSDARTRATWTSHVHPPGEEAMYLSLHTNAGRGRGTYTHVGIEVSPRVEPLPESLSAANYVHAALVAEARTVASTWRERGVHPLDVSEVSPKWNTLPSVLIEIGYHDHPHDAKWLANAEFQHAVARGITKGILQWRAGATEVHED